MAPQMGPESGQVLVIGVAVVDYVFYMDRFPQAAEKYRAHDAWVVGGGCGANAAVAIARLGGAAHLSARLGADATAGMILADLRAEGVDVSLCDQSGARSSCSSILIDAAGERQIVNFRGAGLTEEVDHIAGAPAVGAVLADTRWSKGAIAAMELAQARGVPGVLDVEAGADPAVLGPATHAAFSLQGLADLVPGDPDAALARVVADHGGWACVTLGADGVLWRDASGEGHVPSPRVDVLDTLGAGDVWHGAFALRLSEGASETEAIRFANAVAALKCTRPGGRAGTPDRAETQDFLKGWTV
ncbi:PfkB family carbohydrate kinase [Primorskyibacter aestuariivivens]|uniref:carbohydrate kinase family protein n=1 Tax=Primorskyibacter aestuariivivens TaxID=1888912 RepID=UPI0022FFEE83|nr:PfkB family carbohydrate kinase [Primorskyibacter aestuariivivens]MDA7427949.1 PfkB family carbohydrate kinase [Primorskyibacter aestuariivivens]